LTPIFIEFGTHVNRLLLRLYHFQGIIDLVLLDIGILGTFRQTVLPFVQLGLWTLHHTCSFLFATVAYISMGLWDWISCFGGCFSMSLSPPVTQLAWASLGPTEGTTMISNRRGRRGRSSNNNNNNTVTEDVAKGAQWQEKEQQ
jgi:hypothetical protein